jgi:hypothetical protein
VTSAQSQYYGVITVATRDTRLADAKQRPGKQRLLGNNLVPVNRALANHGLGNAINNTNSDTSSVGPTQGYKKIHSVESFKFRGALQYNIQGFAAFSQRRSILQVHLCIRCNCNKYYRTIRQVVVSIYIYIYIYRHPTEQIAVARQQSVNACSLEEVHVHNNRGAVENCFLCGPCRCYIRTGSIT